MKRIFLSFLKYAVCIFFVAVAAVAFYFHYDKKSKENYSMKGLLTEFSADAPTEIIISWKSNKTTLVQVGGEWVVKERGGHRADLDKVARFIDGIQKIRPLRRAVPVDEQVLSTLRLRIEETDSSKIPGVHIQMFDKDKNVLRDLTLGAGYFNETETVMPGREPEPCGRWAGIVQKDGSIIPVLISSMFEEYTPVPGNWLSCPVFDNAKQLIRINYESTESSSWMIGRFNEKDPFESVVPGGIRVSRQKLNALINVLSQQYIYEAIREDHAGKRTLLGSFSATDSTGLSRTLTFYRAENAKGGVVCRISAENRKNPDDKRVKEFLDGREGWLYVIPDKIFEIIKTNPAGD